MMLDEDDDKGYDSTEWGAFGLIYLLASLSFNDAAPRNSSAIDYQDAGFFTSNELLEHISFSKGTLRFYCDNSMVRYEVVPVLVATLDKELTVKRPNSTSLISAPPTLPILITEDIDFVVWGKVITTFKLTTTTD